jgi:hypothetical protein
MVASIGPYHGTEQPRKILTEINASSGIQTHDPILSGKDLSTECELVHSIHWIEAQVGPKVVVE